MTSPSPDQAALLAATEQELTAAGIKVLDRRWQSQAGDHELDLVASVPGRTLVVPLITIMDAGDGYRDASDLPEDRIQEARKAAVTWMTEHGARYEQIRVDNAAFMPGASDGYFLEYVEEVG